MVDREEGVVGLEVEVGDYWVYTWARREGEAAYRLRGCGRKGEGAVW